MRSLTKTGIRMLSAKYRSILIKCAIINASLFIGVFGASPSFADDVYVSSWMGLKGAIAGDANPIKVDGKITRGDDDEDITISRTLSIIGSETGSYLDGGYVATPPESGYKGLTIGADGNLTLENITMQNFNNTSDGGAISNGDTLNKGGKITDITGNFYENSAKNGGAIYNRAGVIGSITSIFEKNSATTNGGAIYNFKQEIGGTIDTITGNFIKNSAAAGGAIYNLSGGEIGNITGDFEGNFATNSGGAIYNGGTIANIIGDFKGNHADSTSSLGGAIYNGGTIANITGDFKDNYTTSTTNGGGAIANLVGTINISTSDEKPTILFSGNYITNSSGKGGAIWNKGGTVGLYAQTINDSITFEGQSDVAGAEKVDSIYNVNYSATYKGVLNINGYVPDSTDENPTPAPVVYAGTVNLQNVDGDGTTNIYGGTVNVAKDITQKEITVANGATLTTKGNVTTTDGITNAGTLNLTGTSAVVNSVINGENGITNFGDNQHNASIEVQQAISQAINIQNGAWVVANADIGLTGKAFNIEENAALDIAADNIKADIVNKSLELIINDGIDHTSGIISTKITGDGATTLAGKDFFIAENGLIDQDLHLSGTLTTNADKLGDGHQIFGSYGDFPAIVNLTGGILKGSIIGPKTTITDGSSVGIANDYYIGNLVLGNNSTLNQKNNSTGVLNIGILGLTSNNNLMLDADLAGEKMDQLSVMEISGSNTLKISDINLLSDADDDYVELSLFADGTTTDVYNKVSGNLNGLKYSPIYKYDALYDQTTGKIGFTRYESGTSDDFNPYIYTPSVVANTTAAMTTQIATLAMDKMDNVVHTQGRSGGDTQSSSNVWVRVMGLNDNVEFNNFENIDSKALTVAAGFNTDKITCGDCGIVFGAYAGYIGGKQHYTANDIDQDGAYVGLSSALTLGDAFLTATVNGGLLKNKANNMYGTDRFSTLWLGAGLKTGYNFAITDSVVLQPNMYGGYTLVNTQDYTSVSGVKIATNNLNFFEIDPGLKLSAVIADGWTTSVQGKYAIVMDNGANITANDIALQNISTKNYFEYGIGIDKSLTDAFYLGAKINRRDGGRTGWNGSIEFRYKF